jgi:hypothetical protein
MKSLSISSLYNQIDKHILLAQSYTEIKELSFIIRSCRFKPYNYIFENKNKELILHNWWVDEYGNSIKITKSKRLKLIYNDLSLKHNKIVCTDLYYGLPINKIAKMSKLAYFCAGKDEDLLEDYYMISFLGIDNFLRTYLYMYGEWNQVASILLGLNNLKIISENINIKQFLELENKENILIPCILGNAWLTYLPVSDNFLQIIKKQYNIVVSSIFAKGILKDV